MGECVYRRGLLANPQTSQNASHLYSRKTLTRDRWLKLRQFPMNISSLTSFRNRIFSYIIITQFFLSLTVQLRNRRYEIRVVETS